MTTITCTRRLQFCAGHRVLGHEGKCARPHGHNYTLFVTAKAVKLDHLLVREGTVTCYLGTGSWNEWGFGCGTCPACVKRARGWEEARL